MGREAGGKSGKSFVTEGPISVLGTRDVQKAAHGFSDVHTSAHVRTFQHMCVPGVHVRTLCAHFSTPQYKLRTFCDPGPHTHISAQRCGARPCMGKWYLYQEYYHCASSDNSQFYSESTPTETTTGTRPPGAVTSNQQGVVFASDTLLALSAKSNKPDDPSPRDRLEMSRRSQYCPSVALPIISITALSITAPPGGEGGYMQSPESPWAV
eukprot:1615027-Rhodomonas_salina.1